MKSKGKGNEKIRIRVGKELSYYIIPIVQLTFHFFQETKDEIAYYNIHRQFNIRKYSRIFYIFDIPNIRILDLCSR